MSLLAEVAKASGWGCFYVMKSIVNTKDVLIVAGVAILVEGVLFLAFCHESAGHSPTPLLIFHLPGLVLGELAHLSDPATLVVAAFTGSVQLFVLFLFGLVVWRLVSGRNNS